jgi:hypothetical protein
MIYFRKEGDKVRNGFNLYPFNDKSSFGFQFRLFDYHLCFRYSKVLSRWIIYHRVYKTYTEDQIQKQFDAKYWIISKKDI